MASKKEKNDKAAAVKAAKAKGRTAVNLGTTQIRKVDKAIRSGGLPGLKQYMEVLGHAAQPGVKTYADLVGDRFRNRQTGSRFKV